MSLLTLMVIDYDCLEQLLVLYLVPFWSDSNYDNFNAIVHVCTLPVLVCFRSQTAYSCKHVVWLCKLVCDRLPRKDRLRQA